MCVSVCVCVGEKEKNIDQRNCIFLLSLHTHTKKIVPSSVYMMVSLVNTRLKRNFRGLKFVHITKTSFAG